MEETSDSNEAVALVQAVADTTGNWNRPGLLHARAVDGAGDACRDLARPDLAEGHYRRAAELWERLLGPDQPRLAVTLHNLGAVIAEQGRDDEAGPVFRRAAEVWSRGPFAASEPAEASRRAAAARGALSATSGPAR